MSSGTSPERNHIFCDHVHTYVFTKYNMKVLKCFDSIWYVYGFSTHKYGGSGGQRQDPYNKTLHMIRWVWIFYLIWCWCFSHVKIGKIWVCCGSGSKMVPKQMSYTLFELLIIY